MNDTRAPSVTREGIDDCWNRIGVRGNGECPELERHIHCRNCPVYSAAAAALLEATTPDDYVERWTSHFAAKKAVVDPDTQTVVLFRIGREWLALPAAALDEIASMRVIHSLPHRHDGVALGLVNVRGELLICVSLSEVLHLEKGETSVKGKARAGYPRMLVLRRGDSRVVFPVDEAHGIHRFSPRELKEVPATVARAGSVYTKATLPWRDVTVGCLDAELLLHALDRSLS